jgi:hypothetical protein
MKNEINRDFKDAWGLRMHELFSQFASYTETIVEGFNKLEQKIDDLQKQLQDYHKEVIDKFNEIP